MPIDIHIKRVLQRLGFGRYNRPQDVQNLARLICPENPGMVDDLIWKVGREFCKSKPECGKCPLINACDFPHKKHIKRRTTFKFRS